MSLPRVPGDKAILQTTVALPGTLTSVDFFFSDRVNNNCNVLCSRFDMNKKLIMYSDILYIDINTGIYIYIYIYTIYTM